MDSRILSSKELLYKITASKGKQLEVSLTRFDGKGKPMMNKQPEQVMICHSIKIGVVEY